MIGGGGGVTQEKPLCQGFASTCQPFTRSGGGDHRSKVDNLLSCFEHQFS